MGWHMDEIGAMVFISVASNVEELVGQIGKFMPKGLTNVQVLECAALFGHDDIVCRLHAGPARLTNGTGAQLIAKWVNGLANDPTIGPHVKGTRTHIVAFESH